MEEYKYPESLIAGKDGKRRGTNGGRKPKWIGVSKNYELKALRLPIAIYDALTAARETLNVESIVSKLKGLSCTSVDGDGLKYDSILPIELEELKNKLKISESKNNKLTKDYKLLLDKSKDLEFKGDESEKSQLEFLIGQNEMLSLQNVELKNAYDELDLGSNEIIAANHKMQNELENGRNTWQKSPESEETNLKITQENADLQEKFNKERVTSNSLMIVIEHLEQELSALKEQQLSTLESQPNNYESVINEFQKKAEAATPTSSRFDHLRYFLQAAGFGWKKNGTKGWTFEK